MLLQLYRGNYITTILQLNLYRSAIVPRNLPFPEKFLVAHLHSGIILFAKRFVLQRYPYKNFV